MARKITKQLLSGSTRGKPIKVVQTATAGTTVHATGTSASIIDEIWLWAHNSSGTARELTVEFGGVADPDDHLIQQVTIPARVTGMLICPGLPMVGTGAAASTIAAFASAGNVITITGFVNRIS